MVCTLTHHLSLGHFDASLEVRSKHLMSVFPTLRHTPLDFLLISAQSNHCSGQWVIHSLHQPQELQARSDHKGNQLAFLRFVAIILEDFMHAKFHPGSEHQYLCADMCMSTTEQKGLQEKWVRNHNLQSSLTGSLIQKNLQDPSHNADRAKNKRDYGLLRAFPFPARPSTKGWAISSLGIKRNNVHVGEESAMKRDTVLFC